MSERGDNRAYWEAIIARAREFHDEAVKNPPDISARIPQILTELNRDLIAERDPKEISKLRRQIKRWETLQQRYERWREIFPAS